MWNLRKVEKETEPHCWHCGTAIKYVCWIENDETGEVLAVGRNCCSNFMSRKQFSKTCKEIDIQIDNVKKVDKAKKYLNRTDLDSKKQAYLIYLALGGNANLMVEIFPEKAKIMGY
jgi:hypothetical protein